MTILCDLDDTFWVFLSPLLDAYNKDFNDNVKLEEITDYDTGKFLKMTSEDFFKKYANEDFFKKIQPYANAVDFLTALHNDGAEILFVTSGYPHTMPWRNARLKELLPWYDESMLVMCRQKWLMNGDIIIDDNPNIIEKVYNETNMTTGLFAQPWNQNCTNYNIYFRKGWL